jgi:hypothetical protein
MADGVFVSYRRDDARSAAQMVHRTLVEALGPELVFFDRQSIQGGSSWSDTIDGALASARVLVLVIGPRWSSLLTERVEAGGDDIHLKEIVAALDGGMDVYPVLVDGARPLADADLPPVLQGRLTARQWRVIHEDDQFDESHRRLGRDVRQLLGLPVDDRPGSSSAGAPAGDHRSQLTVGPLRSTADHHEIADAVAASRPGAQIRVLAGTYLKPVVIRHDLSLFSDDEGDVVLDCDSAPCITIAAGRVSLAGLALKTSMGTDAVALAVEGGDVSAQDCTFRGTGTGSSTALAVRGPDTVLHLSATRLLDAAVGMRASDGATAGLADCWFGGASEHAVVVTTGARPTIRNCLLEAAGASTVLVTDNGQGAVRDCTIRRRTGSPTIEITRGGSPSVYGGSPSRDLASDGSLVSRLVPRRARSADVTDDWLVHVHREGAGDLRHCTISEIHTATGGNPSVHECTIERFRADAGGKGEVRASTVGVVLLGSAADPVFADGTIVKPPAGTKITVDASDGAAGRFEDCEIVGEAVRDGSADPTVRLSGGATTSLHRCTITNPGEGAVWAETEADGLLDGCDVRSERGPAVVVTEQGRLTVTGGSAVHGGLSVGGGSRLEVGEATVDATALKSTGVVVLAGGSCALTGTTVANVRGRGVAVAGTAVLDGCTIGDTSGAALRVDVGGRVTAAGCTIAGPADSTARKLGRIVTSRSEKVRATADRVAGQAPAVSVAVGGRATFATCTITGAAVEVAPDTTTFDATTLNARPHPPP